MPTPTSRTLRRHAQTALAAAALTLLAPAASHAQVIEWYNTVLSGPAEAPPNSSPGTGTVNVFLNTTANTMRVQGSFSGLLGTTTAAHIHAPTPTPLTGVAGVATQTPSFAGFPLGVQAGSFDQTYDMTLASSFNATFITNNGGTVDSARTALFNAIRQNRSYFNVHTNLFTGGEVRGFLVAAPEPGSVALLGVGLVGAVAAARRRKRA